MELHDLDLNVWKALDALIIERHISRAAQRLGVSQLTICAALHRLRQLTGDELIVSIDGKLMPTSYGAEFGAQVRAVLSTIADKLDLPRRPGAPTKDILSK